MYIIDETHLTLFNNNFSLFWLSSGLFHNNFQVFLMRNIHNSLILNSIFFLINLPIINIVSILFYYYLNFGKFLITIFMFVYGLFLYFSAYLYLCMVVLILTPFTIPYICYILIKLGLKFCLKIYLGFKFYFISTIYYLNSFL